MVEYHLAYIFDEHLDLKVYLLNNHLMTSYLDTIQQYHSAVKMGLPKN